MSRFDDVSNLLLLEAFLTARDFAVVAAIHKSARTVAVDAASTRLRKHLHLQGGRGFVLLPWFICMHTITKLRVFELSGTPRQVDLTVRIFNSLNNHPSNGRRSFVKWFAVVIETEGNWAVTIRLKLWGKIDHIFGNRWPRAAVLPPMTLLNLFMGRPRFGAPFGCIINAVINAGANVDLISVKNYERRFGGPLHLAAKEGFNHIIPLLITAGANINKLCSAQETPLIWAIRYSQRDAVLLLLRGAPGAREKKNMLKLAIQTEREALIKVAQCPTRLVNGTWLSTKQYLHLADINEQVLDEYLHAEEINEQYKNAVEIIEIIRGL